MIEAVIVPRTRELGDGFSVRRALPAVEKRMVGPFVFFDQMGPVMLAAGRGLDVRPHPHIGLATVTYLFEGEIDHRDSLGTVQRIRPGEVNWMTAGRGIVHSERTPTEQRAAPRRNFGIQLWVALPAEDAEMEPAFFHVGAKDLPETTQSGFRLKLIVGALMGERSPVPVRSPMFYADLSLQAGAPFTLPPEHEESAAYVIEGSPQIAGRTFDPGQLVVFERGKDVAMKSDGAARVLLLGGANLGPRRLWWNFVAADLERIEQAAADWKAGRFPAVPGDPEFIPLPERGPTDVPYP
jgi:redox-sensitive bicupin YhaK (pirin superfamily)